MIQEQTFDETVSALRTALDSVPLEIANAKLPVDPNRHDYRLDNMVKDWEFNFDYREPNGFCMYDTFEEAIMAFEIEYGATEVDKIRSRLSWHGDK